MVSWTMLGLVLGVLIGRVIRLVDREDGAPGPSSTASSRSPHARLPHPRPSSASESAAHQGRRHDFSV